MLNNFVEAQGDLIFFDYSHDPSRTSVDAYTNTLTESAETIANGQPEAFFANSGLSEVLTESSGVGTDGASAGTAASEAEVLASFSLEAGEMFSFGFLGNASLEALEIENPDAEYNDASLNMGVFLVDTSDSNNIQVLDYAVWGGDLITSEQIGGLEVIFSDNFTLNDEIAASDIDGNNEVDFISYSADGTYERTFEDDTDLTLLKTNETAVQWMRDPLLIDNPDSDFTNGTIEDDRWFGSGDNDSFYASFGTDRLYSHSGDDYLLAGAGDDALYGGNGNDRLFGEAGNDLLQGSNDDDELFGGAGDDTLSGSNGSDRLVGGFGNDTLMGGLGSDEFIYDTSTAFNPDQVGLDIITDFEVNTDQIMLSLDTFTNLTATVDNLITPNEFEIVDNDTLAAVSEAGITYSRTTGNLFYNQNGSEEGLGEGAHFITLQNSPILSPTDIMLA